MWLIKYTDSLTTAFQILKSQNTIIRIFGYYDIKIRFLVTKQEIVLLEGELYLTKNLYELKIFKSKGYKLYI